MPILMRPTAPSRLTEIAVKEASTFRSAPLVRNYLKMWDHFQSKKNAARFEGLHLLTKAKVDIVFTFTINSS